MHSRCDRGTVGGVAHGKPDERARSTGGAFVAIAVALALIVGGVYWFVGRGDDTAPVGESADEAATPAPADRQDCTQLVVASSPEKHAILSALAGEYNAANREVTGS